MNKYHKLMGFVAAFALAGLQQAGAAIITNTAHIEKSTVWTHDNEYVLADIILVRSNATLTIEAGTVVRGLPDSDTAGANNPGALIITRGSKIKALGTESSPIIFTDKLDDNYPGGAHSNTNYDHYVKRSGQWGALAMLGRTYVGRASAAGPNPNGAFQLEGIAAIGANGLYGGGDDDDDSGIIKYVSIRYSGFGLAANNELNAIGFGAIGRETVLDHIESMNSLDDGFEWWGGTVNAKYLCMWNCGDDGFDIDEGYRGKMQFLINVQGDTGGTTTGSGISDRGMEMDGGNSPDNSQPYGLWKMYNVTVVGLGQNGGDGAGGTTNTYLNKDKNNALYMRDNAGPQIFNSVFMDFGGRAVHMENEGGNGAINVQTRFLTAYNSFGFHTNASPTAAFLYRAQTNGLQGDVEYNIFWQFPAGLASLSTNELASDATSDGSAIAQSVPSTNMFLLPSGANNLTNTAQPIVSYTREATPASNRNANVTSILPLAANEATNSPVAAPVDGFYTPVNYRGAFGTTNNWLANWTAIWALNLTPTNHVNPSAPAISVVITNSQAQISFPTETGIQYSLESTYDVKHWSPVALITGNGSTNVFVDTSALTNAVQYRVVIP